MPASSRINTGTGLLVGVWAIAGCTMAADRTIKAFYGGSLSSKAVAVGCNAPTSDYKGVSRSIRDANTGAISTRSAVVGFSVASIMLACYSRVAGHGRSSRAAVESSVPRKQAMQNDLRTAAVTTTTFDASTQLGVTEPLGFFDPLGITDHVNEKGFRHLRAAELKHGRVAMLAAFGCVAQHYISFPGFEDIPSGIGALETEQGRSGLAALVLASSVVETFIWKEDENRLPGDFGNPWNFFADMEVTDDLRNKELNNGRFAMFAVLAILVTEFTTGKDGVDQILELDMNSVLSSAEAATAAAATTATDVIQHVFGGEGVSSAIDGVPDMFAAAEIAQKATGN